MIAIVVLYSLLALAFTLSKGVLDYSSPVWFTGIRMLIAGILLVSYHCVIQKRSWKIQRADLYKFLLLGVFHIYCAYVFEFWALETVSAAKDALFFNMTPFITALLALILCNERLSWQQWGGLALGFIGFLPLLYAQSPAETMIGHSHIFSWPELYLLIAVTGSSYGWILLQKLINHHTYEAIFANGVAMLLGGAGALVTAFITEPTMVRMPHPDMLWSDSVYYICWYLFIMILLTNVICYTLYGRLLKVYSATFMALAGATVPIFTAIFDWLLFDLTVSWHFVATVIIVFIGLAIFYADEMKK